MKLLIITQKIDKEDSILGFFYRWIIAISKHFEKVTAICLFQGIIQDDMSAKVLSLGKESGLNRISYILNFYRYIWKERKNYDAVFVHMNQIYVILGGLIWKMLGKKIYLWYAHGHVSFSLKIAHLFCDGVITSTKEGFRLKSNKKHIVGQGIELENDQYFERSFDGVIRAMSLGRISPVKDLATFIVGFERLLKENRISEIVIIGGTETEDQILYKKYLENLVFERGLVGKVNFTGAVSYDNARKMLSSGQIFVNTSLTGSLDKSGLEAIASGMPVFTCNPSYRELFGEYAEVFMFNEKDSEDLEKKILIYLSLPKEIKTEISKKLRDDLSQKHSLAGLSERIADVIKS